MISFRYTTPIVATALVGTLTGFVGSVTAVTPSQETGKVLSLADGVYNAAQAQRGQTSYSQVCSSCHLADLSGSDQAPSLAGGEFLDRWDGQNLLDLVDRIRTSMPADNVGSLTTAASTDLVVYMLQMNKFPAGQEELKADRGLLRTLTIRKP